MNEFALIILVFLAITFGQSAIDKIIDWNGNVAWLKSHFANTFIKNHVPAALLSVLALELVAAVLALVGFVENILYQSTTIGKYACLVSAIVLLQLLMGQRLAKDYDGARTIVIYLIPVLLGLYWL